MNKLKTVLIDDESLALKDLAFVIGGEEIFELTATFESVASATREMQKRDEPLDFIFCDIEMPTTKGIDAVSLLRQYARYVVLYTGHPEKYAMQGHQVAIDAYLSKPVRRDDLLKLIEQLQGRSPWKQKERVIWVRIPIPSENSANKSGRVNKTMRKVRSQVAVPIDTISKIEIVGNELAVYKIDKKNRQSVVGYIDDSIKNLIRKYSLLDAFLKPNASILVNPTYIVKLESEMLWLKDGTVTVVTKLGRKHINHFIRQQKHGLYKKE